MALTKVGHLMNGQNTAVYHYDTVNGYGSGSTKIRKWLNATYSTDTSGLLTVINDSVLGNTYTAVRPCIIHVSFSDVTASTDHFGISLNSAQLTTNVNAINQANRLAINICTFNVEENLVSVTHVLAAGDVIRPHCEANGGSTGGNEIYGAIHVVAIEIP